MPEEEEKEVADRRDGGESRLETAGDGFAVAARLRDDDHVSAVERFDGVTTPPAGHTDSVHRSGFQSADDGHGRADVPTADFHPEGSGVPGRLRPGKGIACRRPENPCRTLPCGDCLQFDVLSNRGTDIHDAAAMQMIDGGTLSASDAETPSDAHRNPDVRNRGSVAV